MVQLQTSLTRNRSIQFQLKMMIKLYLWGKTIHRVFMYLAIYMIVLMTITGGILKYPLPILTQFINVELMRYLHNKFSIYFAIVLFGMMITGAYMYLFPILRRKQSQ